MKLSLRLLEGINYDKYSDKMDTELFSFFLSIDPTREKKYSQWIIREFFKKFGDDIDDGIRQALETSREKRRSISYNDKKAGDSSFYSYPLTLEKLDQLANYYQLGNNVNNAYLNTFLHGGMITNHLSSALKNYDLLKNKNKLKPEEKNIMNLPSFSSLYKLMNDYVDALLQIEDEKVDKSESEKWYEDSEWLVVVPLTHRASCKYGANTKWCTAMRDETSNFNYYSGQGSLIIVINKTSNEKWQLHIKRNEWNDQTNEGVDKQEFLKTLPEEMIKLLSEKTGSIWFNPDIASILERAMKDDIFIQDVRIPSLGIDLREKLRYESYREKLDSEYLTMAVEETHRTWDTDFTSDYKYGYTHPWYFLDSDPEKAPPLSDEEKQVKKDWKEEDSYWSESQKEEAGQMSESQARSENAGDVSYALAKGNFRNLNDTFLIDILNEYARLMLGTESSVSIDFLKELMFSSEEEYYAPSHIRRALQDFINREKTPKS